MLTDCDEGAGQSVADAGALPEGPTLSIQPPIGLEACRGGRAVPAPSTTGPRRFHPCFARSGYFHEATAWARGGECAEAAVSRIYEALPERFFNAMGHSNPGVIGCSLATA